MDLVTDVGSIQMNVTKIVLAFALLATIAACQAGEDKTVPDALLGVWKTSEPKYADRHFEIRKKVIMFGTGDGTPDIYPISSIHLAPQGKDVLYTISYWNRAGQQYRFSFYYDSDPGHDDVIRFENQQEITWMKEGR